MHQQGVEQEVQFDQEEVKGSGIREERQDATEARKVNGCEILKDESQDAIMARKAKGSDQIGKYKRI